VLAWTVIALSATWVVFAYAGYAVVLAWLRRVSPRPVRTADEFPPASLIIAVHQGEREIAAKLENSLALDYPGSLEIIVASDACTDHTDDIARSFADRGVLLVRSPERRGKEAAQALGIGRARGEILVFSDVGALLSADAVRNIVRPFADPEVGAVSSEDAVDSDGGEGAYVRLEMALRRMESETGSLVGLSGSFFAVRRELGTPWQPDLASDFRSALEAGRRGLRAVSEPTAQASFKASEDPAREWSRKVRTVRRGIAVLVAYRDLLHPRHGRRAFALWGHKVARFTAPFALLAMLLASAWLAPSDSRAAALFGAQVAAYALAGAALVAKPLQRWLVPRIAAFFLLVNASMLVAWLYHLSGRRAVTWTPTRR
jgi:cellulose synthase/poly-beta-1,6-N-acetylglucosamine synthase-like glycosyltransferase